jgi:hypothetical protein
MKRLIISLVVAAPLVAQTWYPRHNFTFDAGGTLPRGDLKPFTTEKPVIGFGYGYRFHRNFQADVGFDTVFGAFEVKDYLATGFGFLRIRDYQYFVPFGGRAILPFADGRALVYGGGGGAYMRYSESLHQPSDYVHYDCPVCTTRDGWGYYATAGASYAVDRSGHFRVGVVTRVYRGHTEGQPIGTIPGVRTSDRWYHIMGEFGFSF